MQRDQEPGPQSPRQISDVILCRLEELRPHPSYVKHRISVPTPKLSALAALGDLAFLDPIVVTRDRTIIDGYARFELAKFQKRLTLNCIEYDLSDLEALSWLLQRHLPSCGYAPFTRVLLALDMEPLLKEKARANQRSGGQQKSASNLTEAERVDVRKEIAAAAAVSVGTLSKARQLIGKADPELLEALHNREVSIHQAWQWCRLPRHEQRQNLRSYLRQAGLEKTVHQLISQQLKRRDPKQLANSSTRTMSSNNLVKRLNALGPEALRSVDVLLVSAPGQAIALTEDLARAIGFKEEAM